MVRFGIISDPHIALPETLPEPGRRFPLVEYSIAAFEVAITHFQALGIDFLLLPGDLTQHGEPENHQWLGAYLEQLPFPCYVIPGNHDVPVPHRDGRSIGFREFPHYYVQAGYQNPELPYYSCEPAPGLRLIALNSNDFDPAGRQIGTVNPEQWAWLETQLQHPNPGQITLVMIHHNVIPHLPDQEEHCLSQRYMVNQAEDLRQLLQRYGVPLVITGHLHVQDISYDQGMFEITTGSLASYPHPYRVVDLTDLGAGPPTLSIQTHYVQAVVTAPELQALSRQWLVNRSLGFMAWYLTLPPLGLDAELAQQLAPELQEFWAIISAGDAVVHLPNLPAPVRGYFERFNHCSPPEYPHLSDNSTQISLQIRSSQTHS